MARPKDPEKRRTILHAAVEEIAEAGLGAATARIARRAGIAEGTLFTYFPTKDALLNELYVELKSEFYTRVHDGFPQHASLQRRAHHIWKTYLDWALEAPLRRRVSQQLHISTLLTADARRRASADFGAVHDTMAEVDQRIALQHLPPGCSSFLMAAFQEAALELITRNPAQRDDITDDVFNLFWRAVR